MADDLENELRNLKLGHLSESELTAYRDQELAPTRKARAEAHLKQCFICERQLTLLREEAAVLSNPQLTAEDLALVERLMEQMAVGQPARVETVQGISVRERLTEYLRQMAASWQSQFARGAMRGSLNETARAAAEQGRELWRWQSQDGRLRAHAVQEKNGDLTVHFTGNENEMEGVRLNVRIGPFSQEVTLRRIADAEVYAKVVAGPRQRPRSLKDIAIEIV